MARLLIVDDDPDIRTILGDRLAAKGHEILESGDGLEAIEIAVREQPALMLLDLELPGIDGFTVLERLRQENVATTVVVITAFASIEKAVEAMRQGAYDFVAKPFNPGHVDVVVQKALERTALREENRALRATAGPVERPIIGSSRRVRELLEKTRKVAESRSTVLLLGESGTGKEVMARAIHVWSPRTEQPFVPVNCVALSEELLASELFGHERGAFTGAQQRKIGKFELANRGTVFLDEIGDIRESIQTKLLRVLQEHEFERVGGTKPIRVDIRVIAATNSDLERNVREGKFREDLYYRLNVVTLDIPPLRERREDIPDLAQHFLGLYCAETGRKFEGISEESMTALLAHSWPGNIRELENAIERAVVLGGGPLIRPKDLALEEPQPANAEASGADGEGPFHERVEVCKRQIIRQALQKAGGNQTRAAELLGLQRTYLARLIRNLGLRE